VPSAPTSPYTSCRTPATIPSRFVHAVFRSTSGGSARLWDQPCILQNPSCAAGLAVFRGFPVRLPAHPVALDGRGRFRLFSGEIRLPGAEVVGRQGRLGFRGRSAASAVGCGTAVGSSARRPESRQHGCVAGADVGLAPPHAARAKRTSAAISGTIQGLSSSSPFLARSIPKFSGSARLTFQKRVFLRTLIRYNWGVSQLCPRRCPMNRRTRILVLRFLFSWRARCLRPGCRSAR